MNDELSESLPDTIEELRIFWKNMDTENKSLLRLIQKLVLSFQNKIKKIYVGPADVEAYFDSGYNSDNYNAFCNFLERCVSIEEFIFVDVDVGTYTNFSALIDKLSQLPKLRTITINFTGIETNNQNMHRIEDTLKNMPTFDELIFFNLTVVDTDNPNMLQIGDALKNLSSIEELNLIGNKFDNSVGISTVEMLIAKESCLKRLNLADNNLGDDTAIALSKALRNNSTLTDLHLGWNFVSAIGMISIIDSLYFNKTLRALEINHNTRIGDPECRAVAELIKNCSTLKLLDVGGSNTDENGLITMINALEWNDSLIELYIIHDIDEEINKNVGNAIVQALERNCVVQKIGCSEIETIGEDGCYVCNNYNIDEFEWEDNNVKQKAAFYLELNNCNRHNMLLKNKSQYVSNMILCSKITTMKPIDYHFELSSTYHWIKSNPTLLFESNCNIRMDN